MIIFVKFVNTIQLPQKFEINPERIMDRRGLSEIGMEKHAGAMLNFQGVYKAHVLTSATDLGWHFRNLPTIVTAGPSFRCGVLAQVRVYWKECLKIEVLGVALSQ